jgi:hypothetical protein
MCCSIVRSISDEEKMFSNIVFRSGSTKSAGSLVPSPFIMEKNGRLVLATLVAEFNQVGLIFSQG